MSCEQVRQARRASIKIRNREREQNPASKKKIARRIGEQLFYFD
jgi:hypothetical protein